MNLSSEEVSDESIQAYAGENFQSQWMSLEDKPLNITMLVDPRGAIHASTGILPTKAITITPSHYLEAFKKMSIWFHISPLLQPYDQDGQKIITDLPEVPDYQWKWWDANNGNLPLKKEEHQNIHTASYLIDGWLSLEPKETKN